MGPVVDNAIPSMSLLTRVYQLVDNNRAACLTARQNSVDGPTNKSNKVCGSSKNSGPSVCSTGPARAFFTEYTRLHDVRLDSARIQLDL